MVRTTYVWEWPVRLTHWINVISIIMLSVTGFFIGTPFAAVASTGEFVMGWMRFLHFVFGYALMFSVIYRLYWMIVGNEYANWKAFIPWASKKGWEYIRGTFTYYTFLNRKVPYVVGHNALAAMAYSAVFALLIVQVLTGFALYSQAEPGGGWDTALGWLLPIFGNQGLRLTHHMVMWLLIGFAIHHIYSAWLMDVKEKNGTLSSIFGGYKYIDPEELD